MRVGLVLLVGIVVGAGCLGSSNPESRGRPDAVSVQASDSTGAILGHVVDVEERPVPGAYAALRGTTHAALTNAEGTFAMDGVPPGTHTLVVTSLHHHAYEGSLEVRVGLVEDPLVRLVPLPVLVPFHTTFDMRGHWTCMSPMVYFFTPCYNGGSLATGAPEEYQYEFPVDDGWSTTILEADWTPASPLAATTPQIGFSNLGVNDTLNEEYAFTSGRGPGPATIRFVPNQECFDEEGGATRSRLPVHGYRHYGNVFLLGLVQNETQPLVDNFPFQEGHRSMGIGVAVDQSFDFYATVFYHAPAAVDFTALPP